MPDVTKLTFVYLRLNSVGGYFDASEEDGARDILLFVLFLLNKFSLYLFSSNPHTASISDCALPLLGERQESSSSRWRGGRGEASAAWLAG